MNTVRVRTIAPPERRKLDLLKRQLRNQVNASRARIILLSSGGVGNRRIGELVDRTPQWVRKVIHRFNAGGLAAIEWYPYFHVSASPRKFTADVREQIAAAALSPPRVLIGMNQWSLSKLRQYLREQKIIGSISLQWLRTLLRRAGVRWRRTKTWKESTDPEFWAKYQRIRRLYGHRPAHGRRLCVDEFGPLNLRPRPGGCLAGKTKRVERLRATYHRTGGVRHWLAVYDLESDQLNGVFKPHKTWVQFLEFLKWVRRRYPGGETLHIVLDNYGPHLKSEVLIWASQHAVGFYFTPTNASWLNRIECEFTALKYFALDNSDFQNHDELQASIVTYLSWRNGKRRLSTRTWERYRQTRRAA
jgi:transposase